VYVNGVSAAQLAGPVGPYHQPADLLAARDDPVAAQNPDLRFWRESVAPYVDGVRVRWTGTVAGPARDHLVGTARATLFPLRWEETSTVADSAPAPNPIGPRRSGCGRVVVPYTAVGVQS
jgi:hypothetical protein